MAAIWLQATDLENVLSAATFSAIFDDPTTGELNPNIVNSVIQRAEQEVLSWLVDQYGQSITSDATLATDLFLKGAALEYAIVYAFDRYPEYVRANGKEREERYQRAQERMQRVLQSRQRPTSLATQPANVGGFSFNDGHPIIVTSADGTNNGGDY